MAEDRDAELIDLIARGDQEAVRELYRRHGRMVYGIALSICRNASTAEEVTQDVFLRVWTKAATYNTEKARVVSWLGRIARNGAIDALRKARVREGRTSSVDPEESSPDLHPVDPADTVELSRLRQLIRGAVDALPPEHRRALELAFFQGLSHSEIAEKLGHPLGTVKTRIRDALRTLRGKLGEDA
jgi:RNA polymerase sigma-70 factor (ECF subfamily)